MIGKTVSHYQILEKLGEGGMGVVYKAEDDKLNRLVALKFLPLQAIDNREKRARFYIEAQAAAALNHPNICTIYEIDETTTGEHQFFMALEYVVGKTLEQKIAAESFSIPEILEIAIQIVAGLREAHAKGVIHRDIKSANIMVTDQGQVKIMDFGLAKLARGTKISRDDRTPGTVAYISPEQARGGEVDHRTDIWSLGVILYEMLTGELPFEGENEVAMVLAILNHEPKPISEPRRDVPIGLEKIILKCLAKEAENRYLTTTQLLDDLQQMDQPVEPLSHRPQPSHRSRSIKLPSKAAGVILTIICLLATLVLISHFDLFQKKNDNPPNH